MLKRMFALILLLAFAMQTFSRATIALDYLIDTKAYTKNCVNKARPKMHCKGKCQMMKKIQEEEKKDQQNQERKFEKKNEVISSRSFFLSLNIYPLIINNEYYINAASDPVTRIFPVFHPPQV